MSSFFASIMPARPLISPSARYIPPLCPTTAERGLHHLAPVARHCRHHTTRPYARCSTMPPHRHPCQPSDLKAQPLQQPTQPSASLTLTMLTVTASLLSCPATVASRPAASLCHHHTLTIPAVPVQASAYAELDKAEMGIWQALSMLNELREYEAPLINPDDDPSVGLPLRDHAFQTAELCRLHHPQHDWLHLVGLIHSLGKLLAHPRCVPNAPCLPAFSQRVCARARYATLGASPLPTLA